MKISTVEQRLVGSLSRKAQAHLTQRTERSLNEFRVWLKAYEQFVGRPDSMYCRSLIATAVDGERLSKWPAMIESMS